MNELQLEVFKARAAEIVQDDGKKHAEGIALTEENLQQLALKNPLEVYLKSK